MSSTETPPKFEYDTERPPYREIESIDVTRDILAKCTIDHPIIENYDYVAAYDKYWARRGLPQRHTAVARNPNIKGEPVGFPPTSPFEAALASHPASNSGHIRDTRSYAFENPDGTYTIMKGVGELALADDATTTTIQFGRYTTNGRTFERAVEKGWGSIGGLLEVDEQKEVRAFMIADLYQRIFHDNPPMRLPAYILDINEGLKKDGSINTKFPADKYHHVQAQYEVDTPVRTIYGNFIANLEDLWIGLDIESDEGKKMALDYLNTTFTAYVKRYAHKPMRTLELLDLEPVLGLIQKKRSIYIGNTQTEESHTPDDVDEITESLSEDENEAIAALKFEIAKAGTALATKFYEQNTEAVNITAKREVDALAKMIGMTLALGIDIHQTALSKDLSGGKIADLGAIRYNYSEDFIAITTGIGTLSDNHDKKDFSPIVSIDAGFTSIQDLCAMLGIPNHTTAKLVENYFNEIVTSFKKTQKYVADANAEKIADAPKFSAAHLRAVERFQNRFASVLDAFPIGDDVKERRYQFARFVYAACGVINTKIEDLGKGEPSASQINLGTFGPNKIPLMSLDTPMIAGGRLYREKFVSQFTGEPEPWFVINYGFAFDRRQNKFVISSLPLDQSERLKPID